MHLRDGLVSSVEDFHVPELPPDDWFLEVHTPRYYYGFVNDTLDAKEMRRIGFQQRPSHADLVLRTRLEVGGTVLAARLALEHGLAASLGGGTHHAHSDFGGWLRLSQG